jgi:hypothetical protein
MTIYRFWFARMWVKMNRALRAWSYALLSRLHPHGKGCVACRSGVIDVAARFSGLPEPNFAVDVIVTWVDGSRPDYEEKMLSFFAAAHPGRKLNSARHRNNHELRFSLRSLETYAPWLRKIHLVTDGQCPEWLKTDHPKLRLVDHKDFIPAEYLPTFNSHVIEAFLHRVPGLAEHYIYCNDDVFMGRPARKADLFTPIGLPLCFMDWRPLRKFGYGYFKSEHTASWHNTIEYLRKHGVLKDTDATFICAHGLFPQTKSNAYNTFVFYEDLINNFVKNRFRSTNEVGFYCHAAPLWLYANKRIIPCDERHYYVQNSQIDRMIYYKALINEKIFNISPLFFCINDTKNRPLKSKWIKDLIYVLRSYFPYPLSLEKDGTITWGYQKK